MSRLSQRSSIQVSLMNSVQQIHRPNYLNSNNVHDNKFYYTLSKLNVVNESLLIHMPFDRKCRTLYKERLF